MVLICLYVDMFCAIIFAICCMYIYIYTYCMYIYILCNIFHINFLMDLLIYITVKVLTFSLRIVVQRETRVTVFIFLLNFY